jgi:hypothetical protein
VPLTRRVRRRDVVPACSHCKSCLASLAAVDDDEFRNRKRVRNGWEHLEKWEAENADWKRKEEQHFECQSVQRQEDVNSKRATLISTVQENGTMRNGDTSD